MTDEELRAIRESVLDHDPWDGGPIMSEAQATALLAYVDELRAVVEAARFEGAPPAWCLHAEAIDHPREPCRLCIALRALDADAPPPSPEGR